MKSYHTHLNVFLLITATLVSVFVFGGCMAENSNSKGEGEHTVVIGDETPYAKEFGVEITDPVDKPRSSSKRLKPDVSSIKLPAASKAVRKCETEEELVETLCIFANPNGNEYDALSVLGDFRYSNMEQDAKMTRMRTASESWHEEVNSKVGEKCIVTMTLEEITSIDLSDTRATDCASALGVVPEAYTNVKCDVSTNYADNMLRISFDLVKVDGAWYLAKDSSIYDVRSVIVTELFI